MAKTTKQEQKPIEIQTNLSFEEALKLALNTEIPEKQVKILKRKVIYTAKKQKKK